MLNMLHEFYDWEKGEREKVIFLNLYIDEKNYQLTTIQIFKEIIIFNLSCKNYYCILICVTIG